MKTPLNLSHTNLRIPEFVDKQYPLFASFIRYYYQWLGLDGNPGDLTVDSYRSIVECPDAHIQHLKDELLPDFVNVEVSTLRLLLHRHLEFYTAKGSEDSIRFLIRALYNDPTVEITYPQEWILNASDTDLVSPTVIMTHSTNVNMPNIEGALIYGSSTGASARVNNVSTLAVSGVTYWLLNLTDILGDFNQETVVDVIRGTLTFPITLDTFFTGVDITAPGANYCEGDLITVSGTQFIITSVSEGYIEGVTINRRGVGYSLQTLISFGDDFDSKTVYGVSKIDDEGGIMTLTLIKKGGPYKTIPSPVIIGTGVGADISPVSSSIGKVLSMEVASVVSQTNSHEVSVSTHAPTVSVSSINLHSVSGDTTLTNYTVSNSGKLSIFDEGVYETRTNLFPASETFNLGWWSSPAGTLTLNYDSWLGTRVHLLSLRTVWSSIASTNRQTGIPNSQITVSFYMKRMSASGTLFVNAYGGGAMNIDMSKCSDDWERITPNHRAVTMSGTGLLKTDSVGLGVVNFYVSQLPSNGSALRALITGFQVEVGDNHQVYIPTTTTPVSKNVYVRPNFQNYLSKSNLLASYRQTNTNEFRQSNTFTDIVWSTTNAIVKSTNVISPVNDLSVSYLQPTTVGVVSLLQTVFAGITTGSPVIISAWVRSAIPTSVSLVVGTNQSAAINVSDTWQRISWVTTYQQSVQCGLKYTATSSNSHLGIYVYGFQLEVGTAVSDLIITTGMIPVMPLGGFTLYATTNGATTAINYTVEDGVVTICDPGVITTNTTLSWSGVYGDGISVVSQPVSLHSSGSGYQPMAYSGTKAVYSRPVVSWSGNIVDAAGETTVVSNWPLPLEQLKKTGACQLLPESYRRFSGNGGLKFTPKIGKVCSLLPIHKTDKGVASGGSKFGDDQHFHPFHYCVRTQLAENITPSMTAIPGSAIAGNSIAGQISYGSVRASVEKLAHPAGMKMSWEQVGTQNTCGIAIAGRSIAGNFNTIPAALWNDDVYDFSYTRTPEQRVLNFYGN